MTTKINAIDDLCDEGGSNSPLHFDPVMLDGDTGKELDTGFFCRSNNVIDDDDSYDYGKRELVVNDSRVVKGIDNGKSLSVGIDGDIARELDDKVNFNAHGVDVKSEQVIIKGDKEKMVFDGSRIRVLVFSFSCINNINPLAVYPDTLRLEAVAAICCSASAPPARQPEVRIGGKGWADNCMVWNCR